MIKETFISVMEVAEKFSAEIERWNDFGIPVFDLPIGDIPWKWFNIWIEEHFNKDGVEWISWYLWERVDLNGELLACYDENDNEFYVRDIEDLWEVVKEYQHD